MSNNMKNVGPILINDGLKKYMMAIFNKMFFALGLSGVTAFLLSAPRIAEKMAGLSMMLFLATLGISFYLSSRINKIRQVSQQFNTIIAQFLHDANEKNTIYLHIV